MNRGGRCGKPVGGFSKRRRAVLVPSAGSTVAVIDASNLVVNVTGNQVDPSQLNVLVDHASPYFRKGALGFMEVTQ